MRDIYPAQLFVSTAIHDSESWSQRLLAHDKAHVVTSRGRKPMQRHIFDIIGDAELWGYMMRNNL